MTFHEARILFVLGIGLGLSSNLARRRARRTWLFIAGLTVRLDLKRPLKLKESLSGILR
jgi:hypothetical protein